LATRSARAVYGIATSARGTDGRLGVTIRDENGLEVLRRRESTREVFDGAWHHVAWVDDGGDARLFVDGILDATDFSYRRTEVPWDLSAIGGLPADRAPSGDVTGAFAGDIDDVRVFNHPLSDDEVAEIAGVVGVPFRRGDSDGDGALNLTDGVFVLQFLFSGGPSPLCLEAADADDDGALSITDGIAILGFLFLGGEPLPAPGPPPSSCGVDPPGSASLGCETYGSC